MRIQDQGRLDGEKGGVEKDLGDKTSGSGDQ